MSDFRARRRGQLWGAYDEWMIRVVLFDLDGVIRHFDPEHVSAIEQRHGLLDGAIERTAFERSLLEEVTIGRITRAEWVRRVGLLIGSSRAAEEWGRHPSVVDAAVLGLSDELRGQGLITAVLTNGTDTIPVEVEESRIGEHFDAIFNSASIGFIKPDVRAFSHVVDSLGVSAAEIYFTDDSARKLAGAAELGMPTHVFRGVDGLRADLVLNGVNVRL